MLKLMSQLAPPADSIRSPIGFDDRRNCSTNLKRIPDRRRASCCAVFRIGLLIAAAAATIFGGNAQNAAADDADSVPLMSRMSRVDVDAAIALGNLDALARIDKASKLQSLYNAMIETERARLALRRSLARRRALSELNAVAAADAPESPMVDASTRRVQMTTYEENGLAQPAVLGQVVTLMRPKKHRLETDNQGVDTVDDRYRPLVVTRPPTKHLQSDTERPETPISVAQAATIRVPNSDRIAAFDPEPSQASQQTDSPLPSLDGDTASDQTEPSDLGQTIASHGPELEAVLVDEKLSHESTLEQVTTDDSASPESGIDGSLSSQEPRLRSANARTNGPSPPMQLSNLIADAGAEIVVQSPVPAPPVERRYSEPKLPIDTLPVKTEMITPATPAPALRTSPKRSPAPSPEVLPAAAPEASVAMQWPFALGGTAQQELPTPQNGSDVTLSVDGVDVRTVLEMLAKGYGMNILVAPDVQGTVTANVSGLSPEQTLNSLARMCGLAIQREDGVILVYPRDNVPRESRQLRVFPLDFASSDLVEPTVTGLLSPIGSAYTSKVDELDNRKGREAIVVVDTPDVLAQVEQYILQADQAPLQVMIEARVLEIELKDDMEHGVNFEAIFGGDFRVGGFRLTDNIATSTNPFYFAEISGTDVRALLTLLETTTDAKTLATPRVTVVNGQNAKIQVGQQLGFAVATVTQTSTIQDVRYLDTGVVLNVTPTISRDGRVLLQVKPKVSSGAINPETLLPEETTREVETSVMLDNHQGMIVGGLIQEEDRVVIKKLPWLGDVKHVGKLFQRRETSRARTEIIVALIPHIIDPNQGGHCSIDDPMRSQVEWERTETRLLEGPLNRECRPWEARLPDVTSEDAFHRDIDRQRNRHPYCKGCEPIKTGLFSAP